MKHITPEEADAVIRASWPKPYADTLREINYAAYTSECADEPDEAPRPWMRRIDLAMALALIVGAWALVAAILIAVGVVL